MDYSSLYKKTEQYVTRLFNEKPHQNLVYHDLQHTKSVVNKAHEIAGHYQLDEEEMMVIFMAAWFHDAGYLFVKPTEHEEKSIEIMKEFLTKHEVKSSLLEEIAGCIMATKTPRNPKNLLQEIICDADTYNLGSKEFKESNKRVYKELLLSNSAPISRSEFDLGTMRMMEQHEFFTSYCKDLLKDSKKENMKKLSKRIVKHDETTGPEITEKEGTRKGMQTLLRLTSANHIQLSEMADSKANILISVNAIIISVILSVLLRKLQTDPYLGIPTAIFLLSAVTTIIIAILATRPKVTSGTFDDDDVVNKKTNLLFFGNFHKVPQDKYERAMRTMMKDSDYLYSSIVQDIYHLGSVLGKKYKLIRLAYTIFMVGIIVSVLAFGLAAFLNSGPPPESIPANTSGSPF